MSQCHCGHPQEFKDCCGSLLRGESVADSPVQLMRSRYSAFVEKEFDYLYKTQDPQTRVPSDKIANSDFSTSVEFTGLQVLSHEESGNKGRVEFIANYKDLKSGEAHKHHELSQFRKQGGIWYYRQGKMIQEK